MTDKAWPQFIQIYQSIQTETDKGKLEDYYEAIDQWQFDHSAISDQIANPLTAIVNDEIKRKKEQLRNKSGRQKATDWFESLENHISRMEQELAVRAYFAQVEHVQAQPLMELIVNSLDLSTRLINADQQQINQRLEAGDFVLNQRQEELIERASAGLDKAMAVEQ